MIYVAPFSGSLVSCVDFSCFLASWKLESGICNLHHPESHTGLSPVAESDHSQLHLEPKLIFHQM